MNHICPKQITGTITTEDFLTVRYVSAKTVEGLCVVLLGDKGGKDAVCIRENSKKYHPQQKVAAFDLDNERVTAAVENIRTHQKASGRFGRLSGILGRAKSGSKPAPLSSNAGSQ